MCEWEREINILESQRDYNVIICYIKYYGVGENKKRCQLRVKKIFFVVVDIPLLQLKKFYFQSFRKFQKLITFLLVFHLYTYMYFLLNDQAMLLPRTIATNQPWESYYYFFFTKPTNRLGLEPATYRSLFACSLSPLYRSGLFSFLDPFLIPQCEVPIRYYDCGPPISLSLFPFPLIYFSPPLFSPRPIFWVLIVLIPEYLVGWKRKP